MERYPGLHVANSLDDAKSRLAELALIDVQDSTLSIHRLVQNEFLHYMETSGATGDLQCCSEPVEPRLSQAIAREATYSTIGPMLQVCTALYKSRTGL